jgi:hypothetical protein
LTYFQISSLFSLLLFTKVRTRIPQESEPAIADYLDGSKESEGLSAKQIIVKIKEDLSIICGEEVKKKKSTFGGGMFGGLMSSLKKKPSTATSASTSTTATDTADTKDANESTKDGDDPTIDDSMNTVTTTASAPTPIQTEADRQKKDDIKILPRIQTGDTLNGGSRYAAPTPIKESRGDKLKKAAPEPKLLPIVLKRIIRRLGHQQTQLVALGRVVQYMIAERQNQYDEEAGGPSMMHH